MAEFAFNIAEKLLEKLGSLAYQEFCLAWGLESDLKKLQFTFSTIKAVLLDAEEKQATNHELRVWLEELKDAFYDAEDVLDEFECEALRRNVVKRGSTSRKVRRFFSSSNPLAFRLRMGHKLKEIRERFDEIASQKAKFHLAERWEDRRTMHMEREMTDSFVRASDVIGRDSDIEKIVGLLIGKDDDKNVSVIPIVGIGGMGKTTLAKMVYNDERVDRHFQEKMWVCVSDDFDVTKLIKEIIISATRGNCNDLTTIDLLQTRLREILGVKKFLLILDDVWSEDNVKWSKLHDLLKEGATGSKILVTTRSEKVASIMGTVLPPHTLNGLPHEDCMSIFMKWAFKEGQAERYPNLIEMGNDIVSKCKGVPLAVRTLGGLLFLKTDERDWLFVRDNGIWKLEQKKDDILPALKLSYDQMPSHLKRCFAYCSMFPKDYVFDSDYLIPFWMAHGLIQSSTEDEELESVGMRYFEELCSRSFFQDVTDCGSSFRFKMHDLVHDLALFVMQGELSIVNSETQNVSQKVRHLSFSTENWLGEVQVAEFQSNLNIVRTVIFPIPSAGPIAGPSSQSFVDTCTRRFKYLRMLDLRHSSFEVLSNSIDILKHLRYLDLSMNKKIRKLPKSICKLQSLQTLRLFRCLELEMLPDGIQNMISLRFLEITTRERRLPENGIGCLNSLRYLGVFKCDYLEYLFEGMERLKALRTLVINRCSSLILLPRGMKDLTALENLKISHCENLTLELEGLNNDQDFSGLKLRMFRIRNLPQVVALPQWLLQGSTSSLELMEIERCMGLKELPEEMLRFSALKELKIMDCPELSERCREEIGEDWPKIRNILRVDIPQRYQPYCLPQPPYLFSQPLDAFSDSDANACSIQ